MIPCQIKNIEVTFWDNFIKDWATFLFEHPVTLHGSLSCRVTELLVEGDEGSQRVQVVNCCIYEIDSSLKRINKFVRQLSQYEPSSFSTKDLHGRVY